MARLPTNRTPTHPGEMLLEEFLKPLGMTQTELADRIGVSYPRINELVNAKRGVTPDTALRLSRLFGNTPEFWLNGQRNWDLWHAMRAPGAARISKISPRITCPAWKPKSQTLTRIKRAVPMTAC